MAEKYRSITGTRDVLPEEQSYWRFIESKIEKIARLYALERVDPPVFEETRLFIRGVGENTDIVEKEMYTFLDRGKRSLTLRPEFTAGVIRLYLQNGLHMRPKPVKLYSVGPIFRYERPQAGRYRQHTQFNVEMLGESDPAVDFEVMSIARHLYQELGFQGLKFQLNSTGCPVCRPAYVAALRLHYQNRENEICADCRRRLERNALRLLDCKVESCQPVIAAAPVIHEHLCTECRDHFALLRRFLDLAGYDYDINSKLVRGLDYYTKTVFEVWVQGIGAQNAMCGGGRYDGLVELLGGEPTPGIGFGSGIERILLSMKEQGLAVEPNPPPDVYLAHRGDEAGARAVQLSARLRRSGISAWLAFGERSFKSQLREANRQGVRYVLILGEDEVRANRIALKDLSGGGQFEVELDRIEQVVKEKLAHE